MPIKFKILKNLLLNTIIFGPIFSQSERLKDEETI